MVRSIQACRWVCHTIGIIPMQTVMQGLKFKVGHKRPYWKNWSYGYEDQQTYRQKVIGILQSTLQQLLLEEAAENPDSPVLKSGQQLPSPLYVSQTSPLNPDLSIEDLNFHFRLKDLFKYAVP